MNSTSTTAVVGSFQHNDNGTNSGSAYFFDTTTGRPIAKLLPNDGAAHDQFGIAVVEYLRQFIVGR